MAKTMGMVEVKNPQLRKDGLLTALVAEVRAKACGGVERHCCGWEALFVSNRNLKTSATTNE